MIIQFIQGAALLLALCWLQLFNVRCWGERRLAMQLTSGLLFGGICVIGMSTPITLQPGLFFDARTVVLSMAALFGGPLVAAVSSVLAGGYRLWLGGVGVTAGLANVLLPVLFGLAYRYAHAHTWWRIGPRQLLLFGLLLHSAELLVLRLLPAPLLSLSLSQVALPLLLVLPVATLILGLMLADIERHQRTAQALRVSEARMRAITRAVPDRLLVLDEDGLYLDVLSQGQTALDISARQLQGLSLRETLAPAEVEPFFAFIQQTLASENPQFIEYSLSSPLGPRIFEGSAQRIEFNGTAKRAIVLMARDVTERINLDLQQRIAAIAFESQQGMIITDANNRILRVNQAFCTITGYSAQEAVGQKTNMLSSGRQGPEFYQRMWRSLNETGVWQGEIWNRRKNGEIFPEWLTISAACDSHGKVCNYVAALTDISERKVAEEQIKHLAFYDPLTCLPNRRLLLDRLQLAIGASARNGRHAALMFIDLDNFKNINDLHGHQTGDQLLHQAAKRLEHVIRGSDTVARLGGDEFVILLEGLESQLEDAATQAELVAKKILAVLERSYEIAGLQLHSSASLGVVLFADETCSADELMTRADLSMYEAKTAGKNALRFFDPHMQEVIRLRLSLEDEMRAGLAAGEFIAYVQPQFSEARGLLGGEVLVRWQHPQQGLLAPAAFIALAERTGLIEELDFQMLQQACACLARWAQQPELAGLRLAVNLSARLLYQPGFVERLLQLLAHSAANPRKLKLELTETLLLDDMPKAIACMAPLKAQGICFSLDDFGTGYSSMAYLQQLPLDQLKIDQSFVRVLPEDASSLAIIGAICALGESLNLDVIAEGVETQQQHALLLSKGCHHFQGYLFGRPMPIVEFESLASAAGETGAALALG
jgi:diguanylate cyclase (GGDEF)-like protein/PAS domain S-box-containing protein